MLFWVSVCVTALDSYVDQYGSPPCIAHKGAYALGFLHRDVSDGNIMIDENGRGVLIDWELAIRVRHTHGASIENKAGQRDRAVSHPLLFSGRLSHIWHLGYLGVHVL